MNVIKTSNRNSIFPGSRNGTRGSTLIIVLIILSILALVAATLSFTSRLEVISSANFAEGTQARMAAATGVESALGVLPLDTPYTGYTQAWGLKGTGRGRAFHLDHLSELSIMDESARLNINAADQKLLENAIASILKAADLDPSPAPILASEIIDYRYGPDGKPGVAGKDDDGDSSFSNLTSDGIDNDGDGLVDNPEEILLSVEQDGIDNNQNGSVDDGYDGIEYDGLDNDADGSIDEKNEGVDEPDEFLSDPSGTPRGDDQPFLNVAEIRTLPSMTDDIYNALKPYLTVYSACDPVYSLGSFAVDKINANTATAREIFEALSQRFPDLDENLLKQFAVNIVDARDSDSNPASLPGSQPDMPFLGIEKTPFINEVWPDSVTDDVDGDDGQYIELVNPYEEALSVDGWKLEIVGSHVYLSGQISPKGFLIVTDDYNNANDPTPEDELDGYGSLYDIFGVVRGGSARRIVEKRELEIPNVKGLIRLYNRDGALVDYFSYIGGSFNGVRRSFQRDDPRVRYASWTFCTPLKKNLNYLKSSSVTQISAPFRVRDRLFESPVDIMDVFAGYANHPSSNSSLVPTRPGSFWSLPRIESSGRTEIGLRLVDLFTVRSRNRLSASTILESLGRVDEDDYYRILQKQREPEYVFGRININTAPPELLAAIPGLEAGFTEKIDKYRYECEEKAIRGDAKSSVVPFKNVTDIVYFALDYSSREKGMKGQSREQILERFRQILPCVTVQSRTFTIFSENRYHYPKRDSSSTDKIRQPARSVVRAVVHVTREGSPRIIDWSYITD